MALRAQRGTILLMIMSALIVLATVFFLTMNDINQVMRGVGQTPPEDLVQRPPGQFKESSDVERAKGD